MSACDKALARYREKVGEHWKGADDILFRAAWNEGAAERERQETQTRLALLDRAEELTREVDRLRQQSDEWRYAAGRGQEREDAANALLARAVDEINSDIHDDPVTIELVADIEAYLAAQPATKGTDDEIPER